MKQWTPDDYNRGWGESLGHSIEEYGNLELAISFLEKYHHFLKDARVLEVGCGIGMLTNYLKQHGIDIVGTDVSQSAIDYGKHKFTDITLLPTNAEKLDFQNESFDVVISFDLIEHLSNTTQHFKEVYRVLKHNGVYLFATPNKYFNATFETYLCKGFRWRLYHPSLQTRGSLIKLLKSADFGHIKFTKISPVTLERIKQIPTQLLRYLFQIIPWVKLPISLQTNFYVIAKK